jgi:GT2 family glycosyltransferase
MDISIVVVTYNSRKSISGCLASVLKQFRPGMEVVVVDNGSTDGSVELIKSKYKKVKIIENRKNFGAAFARNQAITSSQGNWIVTLDSDIVLGDNFFTAFGSLEIVRNVRIGMVIPNILNGDGSKIYSQGAYLSFLKRIYDYGRGEPVKFFREKPARVVGPCSAAAFYRRKMLEEVKGKTGYFDQRFFFLIEDVDLAWRAQRAGWKSLFCRRSFCFHRGNSCRAGKKVRQYLSYRNRKLMIKKNGSGLKIFKFNPLSWLYESVRFIYLYIFNPYLRRKAKPEDILRNKR